MRASPLHGSMEGANTYSFKLCPDNVMRQCVAGDEIREILAHCHSGPTGGHHSASITRRKVYESRFFWPSIFKDAKDYVMRCDACQRSRNISSRSEMPRNNIQNLEMEHMKTLGSTRKELRDDTTLNFMGIRISKWETRTSLKETKSTMLAENLRSGNLEVLES
ncbi:reverse transcriptase domain-containing protein [Tanacetum coccineum]